MITESVRRFYNTVKKKSINEYFGINPYYNSNLKLNIELDNIKNDYTEVIFSFNYVYKYNFEGFAELPFEINEIIKSYLIDIVKTKIKVNYSLDYPFSCPSWSVLNCYSSINDINRKNTIKTFFDISVKKHNNINKVSWLCYILPEKDILGFIIVCSNFIELFKI